MALAMFGPYPLVRPKNEVFWADKPVFAKQKQVQIPSSAALAAPPPEHGESMFGPNPFDALNFEEI